MTTYVWAELRTVAIHAFNGQTPGAELEQRIIDVFQRHPQIVAQAIDRIAERFHAGVVRSPWPVLAADIERATTTTDITATDTADRDKAIRNAEQWMRTAGLHHDRKTELEDELFGDLGRLRQWRTDQQLHDRMITLWNEVRPAGEQVDRDQEQRLAEWHNQHTHVPERSAV